MEMVKRHVKHKLQCYEFESLILENFATLCCMMFMALMGQILTHSAIKTLLFAVSGAVNSPYNNPFKSPFLICNFF